MSIQCQIRTNRTRLLRRKALLATALMCVLATVAAQPAAAQTETVLYNFTGGSDGSDPQGVVRDGSGNLYGVAALGGSSMAGTVFKLDTSDTLHVLYAFGGVSGDGGAPVGVLTRDSSGNFYGATYAGGGTTCDCGTVFELDTSDTETILHSFTGATSDGANPLAGVVIDSSGNLYGTTSAGGANRHGTVFKIGSGGTETHYSFNAPPDGSAPAAGLIADSSGNHYGTTQFGGANSGGTVFKISSGGSESVLYSFGASTSDGTDPVAGLVMDSSGNLYGTTSSGGSGTACTGGCGTVFKLDTSGNETILYNFQGGTTDGKFPAAGLTPVGSGNFYGTTHGGGTSSCGIVFKLSSSGTETVLHNFAGATSDGCNPNSALAKDSSGNLYGTTTGGGSSSDGIIYELVP